MKTNMDAKVREKLSDYSAYVKGLDGEALRRYEIKLKYDRGLKTLPDPYNIPLEKWGSDVTSWPSLEFGQLYTYLIMSPAQFSASAMKNYRSLEAYRYVESRHVQTVYNFDVPSSPFCFLRADVTPSMRVKSQPHSAWVCIEKETADIYCAHCTCMAGLGETCSHVAAILFKVEIGVRLGFTKKSVTDVARMWNLHFKEQINPRPIAEMQHLFGNRKKSVVAVNPTSREALPDEDVLRSLYEACPNASFFTAIPTVHPDQVKLPPKAKEDHLPFVPNSLFEEGNKHLSSAELEQKVDDICNTVSVTSQQVNELFEKTKGQNVSALWYVHRRGRITGTKAHDVVTRRDTTSPENLTMRVMGYKSYNISKKECVKWGLDNESTAKRIYCEHLSALHTSFTCSDSGFLLCETNPFYGASADGIVNCACCGVGTLEVKCPFKHRLGTVKDATKDKDFCLSENMHLKMGHRYYSQIQFQMLVYGTSYTDFVVMTCPQQGPDLSVTRVLRDDAFIEHMNNKCLEFVKECIIPELLTRALKDKKLGENKEEDHRLWCLCSEPEYGKMVQCSSEDCDTIWFHYACVNIRRKPKGKWFCPRCRK